MFRRATVVDSHDVGAFPVAAWRTRLLRFALAAAAVGLLAAAAASASSLDTREQALIPSDTTGVVVVDLSLSIADEDYDVVRGALRRLIAEDASIGLVVFSDVAYELLPPGTPASALRPMLRLLIPPRLGPPVNPWSQGFRAGTRISSALDLARAMLERDGVEKGSILLVSDLETAPEDVPPLARTVEEIRRSSVELRVFGLGPSDFALQLFAGLLQEDAFAAPTSSAADEPVESDAGSRTPVVLLVLGCLLFLALALHERFGGRLALPRLEGAR